MKDFYYFQLRINKASTNQDFNKLDNSLNRLFDNGVFSVKEFIDLDGMIFKRKFDLNLF